MAEPSYREKAEALGVWDEIKGYRTDDGTPSPGVVEWVNEAYAKEMAAQGRKGTAGASRARVDNPTRGDRPIYNWKKEWAAETGTMGANAAHVRIPDYHPSALVDEEQMKELAHKYGKGPVQVFANPPKKNPKMAMVKVADAVRAWNAATGVAVFQLVTDPTDADIIVNLTRGEGPESSVDDRSSVAGTGAPPVGGYAAAATGYGQVETYGQQSASVIGHEIGHAAGLDHAPGAGGAAEYASSNDIMGHAPVPSTEEAQYVARTFSDTTPKSPRDTKAAPTRAEAKAQVERTRERHDDDKRQQAKARAQRLRER